MDTGSGGRPLDGVRVLDLTRVLSGPHCTRMLCDLGADVIKVEPPDGDMTRFANPRVNGLSTYFVQQNVGKRNVSLDTSTPEGVELLLELAARCDVMIENFRPGVADRMGIGYEAVSARNPTVIYASISGYGQTGPWVHRRAYAPVIGAESGATKTTGDARGGQYANDPLSHADVYTAKECAAAILAALFQRERTGRGDRIDVAMAQVMLYVNEHVHDALWDRDVPADWIRSFQPGDYPVLVAANGEVAIISGHPAERGTFDRFVHTMGRPELLDDDRFRDVPSRLTNIDALMAELADWASHMHDAHAIEEAASHHGLATGRLRSVRDVCDTDWAAERHVVVEVSDRGGGALRIPNAPWRFAGSEVGVRGEARYRGEDNHEVLRELLGLDDERLAALDASGVLSQRIPGRP
ncbi:MAG: CoA transferase [Acidimicrobiales bacterium]|nr:CoA transferase [Acidimicrobiales bacterium]MCB9392537.1 CoA transferase [Acidimicrobiaceae bacterium]